ncbi:MAG: Crp/Fnr family transcriptional regulator [Rhodospirillales bacterium]|jgi:CRP-like cAMP-binding protein|nr:Crp/Fnr family transcriptional regulator [Rhodospirillales bacterium]
MSRPAALQECLDAPPHPSEPAVAAKPPGRGEPLLAGAKLLRGLDWEMLRGIERAGSCRRYRPLEHIIDRDGRTTDVFFIVRGQARILNYSVTGREIAFDDLKPGDYFGELAALDNGPRSANVMAVADTLLLALPQRAFLQILEDHPRVALEVMARLARIVRLADERIMDLSTLAAHNRVQAELLRQVRGHRDQTNHGRISPIPVHSEIASRVSTTRETVARVLNDLARRGIVERTKQALIIHDIATLETIVEEVRG